MKKGTLKTYLNGGFFLIQKILASDGCICCTVARVE